MMFFYTARKEKPRRNRRGFSKHFPGQRSYCFNRALVHFVLTALMPSEPSKALPVALPNVMLTAKISFFVVDLPAVGMPVVAVVSTPVENVPLPDLVSSEKVAIFAPFLSPLPEDFV